MEHRYAGYRPVTRRGLLPRPALFRSVRLNAAGGAAVVLVCLAGAGAGAGAGFGSGLAFGLDHLAGRSPAVGAGAVGAAAGFAFGLVVLIVWDRRRWGRVWTGYSWGADPEVVARTGAELRRLGLAVDVESTHPGAAVLRYRQRDARNVRRALARLGVRPPPHR